MKKIEPELPIAPAQQNNNFWKVFAVGAGLFFLLYLYQTRSLTENECYRLGSNERMNMCLASLRTPAPEPSSVDPESLKKIILTKPEVDTTGKPFFTASIKSSALLPVEDVVVRIRLYNPMPVGANCDNNQLDTQYIRLNKVLIPGDSYIVGEYFSSAMIDRTAKFSYCTDIVSATYSD